MSALDEKAINHQDLAAYHDQLMQTEMTQKSDKTATVSNVSYNSSTGKLQKTINGTTSDVCPVVTAGILLTENDTTGYDDLTPVGGAVIEENDTTGVDNFEF